MIFYKQNLHMRLPDNAT